MEEESLFGIEIEKPKENITGKPHECYVDVLDHFDGDKKKTDEAVKTKITPYVKPKVVRPKRKPKGKITIDYSNYSTDIYDDYKNGVGIGECKSRTGDRFTSVDFEGKNEGGCSPCFNDEEAEKNIEGIKEKYGETYDINIIDNRVMEDHLFKWKDFLEKLCKERNETPLIWFNTSTPYDDEINLRLEEHKCYHNCVSFRFEAGRLEAYDSSFDGGTSMLSFGYDTKDMNSKQKDDWEEKKIREVMEKVFAKKCVDSGFEVEEIREHKIGEDFWLVDKYSIDKRIKKLENTREKRHIKRLEKLRVMLLEEKGKEVEEVVKVEETPITKTIKPKTIDKTIDIDEEIKDSSVELKKLLEKKYGFAVTIRVLKRGEE